MDYPKVTDLIPHRPPMLLIDKILDVQETAGMVQAFVNPTHLFLRKDGSLSPEAYSEFIAQSFGACEACRRLQRNLTIDGGGYLSSVRDMQVFENAVSGDVLTVHTEKVDECFNTYIVRGEVFRGEQKMAHSTVYIFMWQGNLPPQSL